MAASLLAAMSCINVEPTGRTEDGTDELDWLVEHGVTVRETLDPGKIDYNDPARVQLKDTSGSGNTEQLIDVAVGWEWEPEWSHNLSLGPALEYHRNTDDDANVETFSAGLSSSYTFDNNYEVRDWAVIQQVNVLYQSNRVQDSDGVRVKAATNYVRGGWITPPSTLAPGKQITFLPSGGVIYDDQDNIGGESSSRWLLYGKSQARLYLWPRLFVSRLYAEGNATYWRSVSASGGYDTSDRDTQLYKLGINYFLDREQRLGLAFEYQRGANPETAQAFAEFVLLTLKIKL